MEVVYGDTFSKEELISQNLIGTLFGNHATFNINGGDNTKLDFGAGKCRRFNETTRKYETISWDAIAGYQQDAISLASSGPWYYIKLLNDGSPITSSNIEYEIGRGRRYYNLDTTYDYIRLGRPRNDSNIGIAGFSFPLYYGFDRHILQLGPTRYYGLQLAGSVGDLQVDLTEGALNRLGAGNHFKRRLKDTPTITGNRTSIEMLPAYRSNIASPPVTTLFGTLTTILDVTNYDDGSGILNALSPNTFANHYIVLYASIDETQTEVLTILHFYGTQQHGTLAGALANVKNDLSIPDDSSEDGLVLGCFSVKENVLDLGSAILGGTDAALTPTDELGKFR